MFNLLLRISASRGVYLSVSVSVTYSYQPRVCAFCHGPTGWRPNTTNISIPKTNFCLILSIYSFYNWARISKWSTLLRISLNVSASNFVFKWQLTSGFPVTSLSHNAQTICAFFDTSPFNVFFDHLPYIFGHFCRQIYYYLLLKLNLKSGFWGTSRPLGIVGVAFLSYIYLYFGRRVQFLHTLRKKWTLCSSSKKELLCGKQAHSSTGVNEKWKRNDMLMSLYRQKVPSGFCLCWRHRVRPPKLIAKR